MSLVMRPESLHPFNRDFEVSKDLRWINQMLENSEGSFDGSDLMVVLHHYEISMPLKDLQDKVVNFIRQHKQDVPKWSEEQKDYCKTRFHILANEAKKAQEAKANCMIRLFSCLCGSQSKKEDSFDPLMEAAKFSRAILDSPRYTPLLRHRSSNSERT